VALPPQHRHEVVHRTLALGLLPREGAQRLLERGRVYGEHPTGAFLDGPLLPRRVALPHHADHVALVVAQDPHQPVRAGGDGRDECHHGVAGDVPVAEAHERLGGQQRHVCRKHDDVVDLPLVQVGVQCRQRVDRTEQRLARLELHVVPAHHAGDLLCRIPKNADDVADRCLPCRSDDALQHGDAADGQEDLWLVGVHTHAPAAGEHGHEPALRRVAHAGPTSTASALRRSTAA
jgi:hypothetical protein